MDTEKECDLPSNLSISIITAGLARFLKQESLQWSSLKTYASTTDFPRFFYMTENKTLPKVDKIFDIATSTP